MRDKNCAPSEDEEEQQNNTTTTTRCFFVVHHLLLSSVTRLISYSLSFVRLFVRSLACCYAYMIVLNLLYYVIITRNKFIQFIRLLFYYIMHSSRSFPLRHHHHHHHHNKIANKNAKEGLYDIYDDGFRYSCCCCAPMYGFQSQTCIFTYYIFILLNIMHLRASGALAADRANCLFHYNICAYMLYMVCIYIASETSKLE